ncbi:MAG: uroporphyrinogen decarboxylase family protein [Pirellulaceae bacterium]
MNGKERIGTVLQRGVPDVVPVFEWFIDAAVGSALTGSEDALDIVERLDLDGFNVRADYRQEFLDEKTLIDEWGIKRQLTGDVLPALLASPISDVCQHAEYTFPNPAAAHRFDSLEKALERFGDERAVILNLRDGFSDMRDLLGYEGALMAMLLDPKRFSELLERSVAYNLELARVAKRRFGTTIVATTDDVANAEGMLMRPDTYLERIGPMFRNAIQGYKELGYLCIKHCDGNIDAVIDFWIDCGVDCLDPIDPGAGYVMGTMKAKYGERVCLKGNIDCTGALCDGTPQQVEEEVRQCILGGGPGGGLILSSSNTIHRGVQPENFQAMLKAARQYGRYPDLGNSHQLPHK